MVPPHSDPRKIYVSRGVLNMASSILWEWTLPKWCISPSTSSRILACHVLSSTHRLPWTLTDLCVGYSQLEGKLHFDSSLAVHKAQLWLTMRVMMKISPFQPHWLCPGLQEHIHRKSDGGSWKREIIQVDSRVTRNTSWRRNQKWATTSEKNFRM